MKISYNKMIHIIFLAALLFAAACSSSSSNVSGIDDPYEKQDISGVWLGYLGATFVFGIITEVTINNYSVMLIGQNEQLEYNQFLSPDGSYIKQTENSAIFTGYLQDLSWDASGSDYSVEFISSQPSGSLALPLLYITGPAATKRVFGGPPYGAYTYGSKDETGILALYYNTTYDIAPNVNNISGKWEIKDIFKKDNTLDLVIQPNTDDTKGTTISGHDSLGNNFNGTITIYYNPNPHNVYQVFLKMNNTIDLSGMAAYVLESSTNSIVVNKKILAIGATNSTKSYSLNGLADLIQ